MDGCRSTPAGLYYLSSLPTRLCHCPCLFLSVCLFVREQDYMESFQLIILKPCNIVDSCHGKNPLNFGVSPTHIGQMAAILDFCYSVFYTTQQGPA